MCNASAVRTLVNDSAAGRVQRSMRGLRPRQRRNGRPTPIELLLGDPGTVYAAAGAFALVERPEVAAWPLVASVGPRTVTLRWAGGASTVPEPEAPWRVGHDARVWIADRDEIGVGGPVAAGTVSASVLVIGQFQGSVVFVNTSRAPGPIVVGGGSSDAAGLLRELLTRQIQMTRPAAPESGDDHHGDQHDGDDAEQRGAWWQIEVEGDAVMLLGLAIARMFTADEVRLAGELMGRATVQEREHRRPPVVQEREAEQIEPDGQSDPAEHVAKQGEPEPESEPEQTSPPEPEQASAPEPEQASAPEPEQASAPEPTADSKTIDDRVPALAPAPPTVPMRTPARAEENENLDDWAAGFAVSSRTSSEPTEPAN